VVKRKGGISGWLCAAASRTPSLRARFKSSPVGIDDVDDDGAEEAEEARPFKRSTSTLAVRTWSTSLKMNTWNEIKYRWQITPPRPRTATFSISWVVSPFSELPLVEAGQASLLGRASEAHCSQESQALASRVLHLLLRADFVEDQVLEDLVTFPIHIR
jgi:hypothetical protein